MKINLKRLAAAIIVCNLAGAIGALFTAPGVKGWYLTITRPAFSPPNWVFAPVWTALYVMMGIALYLVWNSGAERDRVRPALTLFWVQLALNALWPMLFFGLGSPYYAAVEIVLLWLAIIFTILDFKTISVPAALLLVPYLCWVSFASALNYAIWIMN